MPGNPFKGAARPRAGKASVKSPRKPSPRSNQKPANVGSKGQGTGTTPGFRKTMVTTDAKRSVTPKPVPSSVRVNGGGTARPPR